MTEAALVAFLLVFVRCSAMFLTSPVFGAQSTPLIIRVFTTLAVASALTVAIRPDIGPIPSSLYALAAAVAREALAGILIGTFVSLSMQAIEVAGSLMDLSTGLGSSRMLNPLNGVQSSIFAQLKSMLAIVVFLGVDAHHLLLSAFVRSYHVIPSFGAIEQSLLGLIQQVFLIALQIAAPVMAVGFLVDAALGLMTRAVPQMQALHVGLPAKIGAGIAAVALTLPMAVSGVYAGLQASFHALRPLFRF